MSKDIDTERIHRAALAALGKKMPGDEKYFCWSCDLRIDIEGLCDICEKRMALKKHDDENIEPMGHMNEALEAIVGEPTGLTSRYLADEWEKEVKNPDNSYANRKG